MPTARSSTSGRPENDGPDAGVVQGQCEYNRRFYEWLHKVRPGDAHDWKVSALFYSELHRVNYWFVKETGRAPENHFERNRRVERELPHVFKDYRDLHMMSMQARYSEGHKLEDDRRKSAAEAANWLDGELPF